MNKTIFITGASTGLGKATALLFANKGWNVIATMRNPDSGKGLEDHPLIKVLKLDVTNLENIKETASKAIEMGVDVVFNNAGMASQGRLKELPMSRSSPRLIPTSWGRYGLPRPSSLTLESVGPVCSSQQLQSEVLSPSFNSIYHATKWALEGWSESMGYELEKFGIGIKTVSPGGIETDFISRSLVMTAHPAYDDLVKQVFAGFTDSNSVIKPSTAEQIAEVVYEAATDGNPQLRYVAGEDARQLYKRRLEVGDELFRKDVEARFFA